MMHEYHDNLPGFDQRQIWHDGCAECEQRGESMPRSMSTLDAERFRKAWVRTSLWMQDDHEAIGPLSQAEIPLLRTIEAMQHALRNAGATVEWGDR